MNGYSGYPPAPYGHAAPASYGHIPAATPFAPNAAPAYGPPSGGYGIAPPAARPAYGPTPSYAPPQHFGYQQPPRHGYAERPGGTGAPALRWVVLGSFVGTILTAIIGGAITDLGEGEEIASAIGGLFSVLAVPLVLTYVVTALVWLYKSWEMLPASARVTGNGTRVTPGSAVGCLFIPFYNLYWYFMVSAGYCTALNRALESYGSPKRASNGLAITAAIFQVIPYANLFIAPFLWIAFMFNVESAKREYARLSGVG